LPSKRDSFAADIFAPSFFEGHGGNHDFSQAELQANLELALGRNKD
jgi:hypothetical protein